jgi:hypothetical protein
LDASAHIVFWQLGFPGSRLATMIIGLLLIVLLGVALADIWQMPPWFLKRR